MGSFFTVMALLLGTAGFLYGLAAVGDFAQKHLGLSSRVAGGVAWIGLGAVAMVWLTVLADAPNGGGRSDADGNGCAGGMRC